MTIFLDTAFGGTALYSVPEYVTAGECIHVGVYVGKYHLD